MAKQSLALVGATGETGKSILNGLVEDGTFDITLIIRPSSVSKPTVQSLIAQGFPILPIDASSTVDPQLLTPFSIIISAVNNFGYEDQSRLATAAKAAGVQRFVPCGYTTIAPAGGIMLSRDAKELAYNHIFQLKLGYTIVDVGFWHQISYPRVPSGRLDYTLLPSAVEHTRIIGDGNAKNLLTDLSDVGRFVARIVKDQRTLNKKVIAWSDELTQNEIFDIIERLTGEKLERTYISNEDVEKEVAEAREPFAQSGPKKFDAAAVKRLTMEYTLSKYVREDNTLENALYLGYLDARVLYPDFVPISFEDAMKEVVEGRASKLYEGRF